MLTSLSVQNFRCIEDASLELDPEGTGLIGPNGAGKTSLLEAIYFLAHGRSFRSAQRARLVGSLRAPLRVVGTIQHSRTIVAGVEYQAGTTRARVDGENVRTISRIAELLPVQVIDPSVHRLIEEGSTRRRRLLDWGVFHVEHGFMDPWRRYQRALAQRNAALRTSAPGQSRLWEPELALCAADIDRMRRSYAQRLAPVFQALAAELSGRACEIGYDRGWEEGLTLAEALARSWPRDTRVRTTTVGPHRADLIVRVDGEVARERVSRGQQKVIAASLVLAQITLAAPSTVHRACLLLDDPAAELDVDNLGKILSVIKRVPAQLVVTSLNKAGLRGINIGKRFHVEQGRFTEMV